VDGLRPEHLKAICHDNDLFHAYVVKYVCEFWEELRVPKDWEVCDTNLLFKKGDASSMGNYRTIMKLVVQEKLVLTIIGERLHRVIESLGAEYETQNGFKGGVGTTDAIFAMRTALRKRKEHGHDTWVAFIDLVKAFDTISREILWVVLRKLGCPERFVARIKALHDTVIILIRKGDDEIRVRSWAGVRQGDILGPPLFNLYMAAVLFTFRKLKTTSDCEFLTDPSAGSFVIHGRKRQTKGDTVVVNEVMYADDTGLLNRTRNDLTLDLRLIRVHFVAFGMNMHAGARGVASKTECVYFAKQPARYENYATFDGADRTCLVLDVSEDPTKPTPGYILIPFTDIFCYLGALLDEKLSDLTDAVNRLQKSACTFGRFKSGMFVGNRLTLKSKRMMYRALVTSTALYGCESWSVTAAMERKLLSQQTQHCARMLGIRLSRQIDEHITAASMREKMGLKSVLFTMRYLQLNWLGRMRRMPMSRLPRQLLVSWLPDRRLSNYNQTYSRTVKKALQSIGIWEEAHWPVLAKLEDEWHQYIQQTEEDRDRLLWDMNISAAHVAMHFLSLHRYQRDLTGPMKAYGLRRSEFILTGGEFVPIPTNPFLNPSDVDELRALDLDNCFDPDLPREKYPSCSPESLNAQLVRDAGVGGNLGVRLSMNGVHYCRKEWELRRPTHRFSWMRPADDAERRRDPTSFVSSSSGPSTAAPPFHRHCATFLEFATITATAAAAPPPPSLQLGNHTPQLLSIIDHIPHDPNSADPLGMMQLSNSLPFSPDPSTPEDDPDDEEPADYVSINDDILRRFGIDPLL
jgi:hypothetical protein